jgi:hypothetical protein
MNVDNGDAATDMKNMFTLEANADGTLPEGERNKALDALRKAMDRMNLPPEDRALAESKVDDFIASLAGKVLWEESARGIMKVLKRMAEKLQELRGGIIAIGQAQGDGKGAFRAGEAYSEVSTARGMLELACVSLEHLLGECGCQNDEHDGERVTDVPPAPVEATP